MTFDLMLGVPIDSSGAFVGCERLPAALRAAGLVEALGIPDLGNLQVTIADPVRDPEHGVLGLRDAANACQVVRRELAPLLADGRRPLVLGGCCTLLIGVMAALRDNGTDAGLLFVDGPPRLLRRRELALRGGGGHGARHPPRRRCPRAHRDRRHALRPPRRRARQHGRGGGRRQPLARPADVRARHADRGLRRARPRPGGPRAPRGRAPPRRRRLLAAPRPRRPLQGRAARGFDYAADDGITWDELLALLRPVLADPALLCADVTILNPTMDPDGRYAARAVELLRDASA